MQVTTTAFARHSRRALCAGLFLTIASTAAMADDRCRQLEALNQQYAGVSLTADQQQLKRRLVAWYKANCGSVRRAAAAE